MPNKDIEKQIQQIEDVLPQLKKQVEDFKEAVKRINKFALGAKKLKQFSIPQIKQIFDKLGNHKKLSSDIAELSKRLDDFYTSTNMPKQLDMSRKMVQLNQNYILDAYESLQQTLNVIAKNKMSKDMKIVGDKLFDGLVGDANSKLDISKFKVDKSSKVSYIGKSGDFTNEKLYFMYYLELNANLKEKEQKSFSRTTIYVVLSQWLRIADGDYSTIMLNVFTDVIPEPPFKSSILVARDNVEKAIDDVVSNFDYYGLGVFVKNRGKDNLLKVRKDAKAIIEKDSQLIKLDVNNYNPVVTAYYPFKDLAIIKDGKVISISNVDESKYHEKLAMLRNLFIPKGGKAKNVLGYKADYKILNEKFWKGGKEKVVKITMTFYKKFAVDKGKGKPRKVIPVKRYV